jgi:ribose transport system substrate-binding protein
MPAPRNRYVIRALVRASEVLAAFRTPGEVLRLRDVVARTGFDKGTAFRLMYTMHLCGMLEKLGGHHYRCPIRLKQRKYRIGYASGGDNSLFNRELTEGIAQAAEREGLELLMVDNRYSPTAALRAVDELVRESLDVIIEYQCDYRIGPKIAAKCAAEKIPLIAVEIPHPGAIFFGADNHQAGLIGGRYLGKWAKAHWGGKVDEIILLEQRRAGPLPNSRVSGTYNGITEVLPQAAQCPTIYLDGDSNLARSIGVVRTHLRFGRAKHVLVGAIDDVCAIGALRAFEEAGRADCCAVMGQNAAPDARIEMRRPDSRLIGSVAYFPEKYGNELIRIALDILADKPVPPAIFVKHCLITRENVDRYYPNDSLLGYATAAPS